MDLATLTNQLETLKQSKARLEGSMQQQMETLKAMGYETLEEAQEALSTLRAEIASTEPELRQRYEEFISKYSDSFRAITGKPVA